MNVNSLNAACDKQRKALINLITFLFVGCIIIGVIFLLKKTTEEDLKGLKESDKQSNNIAKSSKKEQSLKDKCYLSKNETCYYPNCILSSSKLLSKSLQRVPACQNFYKYSCGGGTITRLDATNSKLIRIFDQDFPSFVKRFK